MEVCPLSGKPCGKPKRHHITEIIDGETQSFFLCEECAGSFFVDEEVGEQKVQHDIPSPIKEIFSKLSELFKDVLEEEPKKNKKRKIKNACPNCNTTLEEISNEGVGCIKCFEFFGNLKKNKSQPEPHKKDIEEYKMEIQYKLQNSLQKEDYETATLLKAKIEEINEAEIKKEELEHQLEIALAHDQIEAAEEITKNINTLIAKTISDSSQ
jgi:protein-arginine kinase activator protein McsA